VSFILACGSTPAAQYVRVPADAGCSACAIRAVYRSGWAWNAARVSGDEKRYIRDEQVTP
jgi:hypothetical protein